MEKDKIQYTDQINNSRQRFVSLLNYIDQSSQINLNRLHAKYINGFPTYKLENTPGLVWASKESNDEFYSEYEKVQPASRKYAIYYEPKKSAYTINPKFLLPLRRSISKLSHSNRYPELKSTILEFVKRKTKRKDIEHVICEIDSFSDVTDLHTLFETSDIEKIVEGYGKSFSATFWNYIDENDSSAFQVPSLMITDPSSMNTVQVLNTIPYERRKMGVDKITGIPSMEINLDKINLLYNQELSLESTITLLKLKTIFQGSSSLCNVIDHKLNGSKFLDEAMNIIENDKNAIQMAIILKPSYKSKIKKEILENTHLQEKLATARLQGKAYLDEYMAVYVEISEEAFQNDFLRQKDLTSSRPSPSYDKAIAIPTSSDTATQPLKNTSKISHSKPSFREKVNALPFFKKVKQLFKKEKNLTLPSGVKQKLEHADSSQLLKTLDLERKNFVEPLKHNARIKNYPFSSLKGAIQQYLYAYIIHAEKGNPNSYCALTSIAGKIEPGKSHKAEESMFLNFLRNSKRYHIMQQQGNGQIVDSNQIRSREKQI